MKTTLLASAVALGLSTGAAFAAASANGDISTAAKPASGAQTAQQFDSVGTVAPARGRYVAPYGTPSWSNPSRQVERGPNGAISLWAPSIGGGN
jgi:hypothetical protein